MSVHLDSSQIKVLAADFDHIPSRATRAVGKAVESTAKDGNRLAQGFATASSGSHGKWYPRDFTAESAGALGLTWAYGPVATRRQGGMSFEFGSRNQKPHLDLAKSADFAGPLLQKRVGDAIDGVFDDGG